LLLVVVALVVVLVLVSVLVLRGGVGCVDAVGGVGRRRCVLVSALQVPLVLLVRLVAVEGLWALVSSRLLALALVAGAAVVVVVGGGGAGGGGGVAVDGVGGVAMR